MILCQRQAGKLGPGDEEAGITEPVLFPYSFVREVYGK